MPVSLSELQLVTIPSSFAYRYGDRAYFAAELNVMSKHFFAKFRTLTGYTWSRVTEVVEDLDAVYPWSKKNFHVKFRMEGISNLVPLHALSTKGVEIADVQAYIAKRKGLKNKISSDVPVTQSQSQQPEDGLVDEIDVTLLASQEERMFLSVVDGSSPSEVEAILAAAESDLPNSATVTAFTTMVNERIVSRKLTNDDHAAEIALRSELKDRSEGSGNNNSSMGNIAVRHTVMHLQNLQAETQSGASTSFHPSGISARAMQLRSGDHREQMNHRNNLVLEMGRSSSQFLSFSQSQSQSQVTEGSPLLMSPLAGSESQLVMTPRTPLLSQRTGSDLWATSSTATLDADKLSSSRQRALADEARFAQYIAIPERSMFTERLARMSSLNTRENAKTRSKAELHEKQLNRTGNIVESGGLWITDDEERRRMAAWHTEEEHNRQGGGDQPKKENKAPAAAAAAPAASAGPTAAPAVLTEEEKFIQKCIAASQQSQSMSSEECIDAAFLDDLPKYVEEVLQSQKTASSPLPRMPQEGEGSMAATDGSMLLLPRSLSLSQRAMSIGLRNAKRPRQ